MARASIHTLLSLDRYAKILGVAPPHFNQGTSNIVFPMGGSCSDVWWQYSWQNADSVSREDLALAIANAEEDIAEYIGWWPAPRWIEQDVKQYPKYHRPDVYAYGGKNVYGQYKSIQTQYGKVIEPGQRAVSLISSPTVAGGTLVFSDEDGDGFSETVTVTATIPASITEECEVKIYFNGHNGEQEWEIRPPRTFGITAGTLTATYWSWQFIDPDLWEELPVDDFGAIELDGAVYVNTVDVYREYNDPTATSAVFYWESQPNTTCSLCSGLGCTACALVAQDGCAQIRDANRGVLALIPATYASSEWGISSWSIARDPDQAKVYYYCGDLSWKNLAGRDCDGLSDRWAEIIAMLATARLERPFCSCGNSGALAMDWREDLAREGGVSFAMLDNPFGTRRGEVKAWQRISRLTPGRLRGATAV